VHITLSRLAAKAARHNPVYLISAALMILGVYTIVRPGTQTLGNLPAILATFFTLQFYELLLVGIAILLVCRRRVMDDGATLALIESLLAIGCFVIADELTFKDGRMALGLLLGFAALVLAAGRFAALGVAVGRRLVFSGAGLILVALLSWNAIAPNWVARLHDLDSPLIGVGCLSGWWVLAVLALGFALNAAFERDRLWPETQPFVKTPLARWAIAGLVLTGSALHEYWLGYILDVSFQLSDILPLVTVAAFGAMALAARSERVGVIEHLAAGAPAAVAVLALLTGGFEPQCPPVGAFASREAFVHELRMLSWPTAWLAVAAGIVALQAWRRRSVPLAHQASACLLLAVLFSTTTQPEELELAWNAFEFTLAAYCLVMAAVTARAEWAAGCLAALNHLAWRNLPAEPGVGIYVEPYLLLLALIGASYFALWLMFRRQIETRVAHMGSLLVLVAAIAVNFSEATEAPAWALAAATLLIAAGFAVSAWSLHWPAYYGLALLTATVPLAREVSRSEAKLGSPTGWVLVMAAFVALGLGFLVSMRKRAATPGSST